VSELTPEQAKAAKEYGLADALASRLVGTDYDEVSADAQTLVDALKDQAAVAPVERNPNVGELAALASPKRGYQALVDSMHIGDSEEHGHGSSDPA
jgi:hypothetical protein